MWTSTIEAMLDTIRQEAKYTASATGRAQFSEKVMEAMREVDRQDFVPAQYQKMAYDNGPLPIGHGQTISQPYIVALMSDLLDLNPDSKVLEIGTGSGYQAAILSRLVKHVYSLEQISALAEAASARLQQLGYGNVEIRCADGYYGWQEQAPFDAIIVTAAAEDIPPSLLDQLKPGGRLVIPVGQKYMPQRLLLITKDRSGNTQSRVILDVEFVPLVTDAARTYHENNEDLHE